LVGRHGMIKANAEMRFGQIEFDVFGFRIIIP